MSGHPLFAEQVAKQRDDLRDRLAALDYVAQVNADAERMASYAKGRERGGLALDPADPTHVVMPLVWLRALLDFQHGQGAESFTHSPEVLALARQVDAVRHDDPRWRALVDNYPALATALVEFAGIV